MDTDYKEAVVSWFASAEWKGKSEFLERLLNTASLPELKTFQNMVNKTRRVCKRKVFESGGESVPLVSVPPPEKEGEEGDEMDGQVAPDLNNLLAGLQGLADELQVREDDFNRRKAAWDEMEVETQRKWLTKEAVLNELEVEYQRKQAELQEREAYVLENERKLTSFEEELQERERKVLCDEEYQAVKNKEIEDSQIKLNAHEHDLKMSEEKLKRMTDECKAQLARVKDQENLLAQQFDLMKTNRWDAISELSPQVKAAENTLKMMTEHHMNLQRLIDEKAVERQALQNELEMRVNMLTTLKSDACKISAEVNELVVHADGKADATLETLETDRKIKELKRLTEVLARFAEKQEKRRLHLDVSEGRLRILIQNNTQQLQEIDEKFKLLEEQGIDLEKLREEVQKSRDKIEESKKMLQVGIEQLNKDKKSWKTEVVKENMKKCKNTFGNLIFNVGATVDVMRGVSFP